MKKQFVDSNTFELIIQYLDKEIDNDNKKIVDGWIKEDKDNYNNFKKIEEIWLNFNDLHKIDKDIVKKDWEKVLKKIEKSWSDRNKSDSSSKIYFLFRKWMQVAALVILVISLTVFGILIYQNQNSRKGGKLLNEITIPYGQKSQITLSDGSQVWVNSGSILRFPNSFNGKIREVWLEGEAFFDVSRNKSKPFYVRTHDINIKVLGTSFNVKAYKEDGIIETTVLSGKVIVQRIQHGKRIGSDVVLEASNKAVLIKNESSIEALNIKSDLEEPVTNEEIVVTKLVTMDPIISWKEDKLIFDSEPFESIAKKLERRYDVIIIIEDNTIKKYRYSGVLKKVSIEQAMKAIQITSKFNYTIDDNVIRITSENNQEN